MLTFDLDGYLCGALRAGASGFLLKDATPHLLQRQGLETPGWSRAARWAGTVPLWEWAGVEGAVTFSY